MSLGCGVCVVRVCVVCVWVCVVCVCGVCVGGMGWLFVRVALGFYYLFFT
jgi:hypothetical protein